MIGTLGKKIVFEVSDERVFTWSSMSREVAGRWASHTVMGVKPKSEFMGAENQSITIQITLSAALGVRPRAMLEQIEAMVEAGEAEYFIVGSKPVGKNPFRITASSETWDKVFNRGELYKATLSITLEEYT